MTFPNAARVFFAALLLAGCGSSRRAADSTTRPSKRSENVTAAATATTTATTTTSTSPAPTTVRSVHCDKISGITKVPGGEALMRSPATDHIRTAVVMLHGYTATTDGEESVSGWSSFLAGTDAVVAYPQGNPTPQGGYGWTTGTARYSTSGTDDVGVIAELVTWLIRNDCVGADRVLIAGESNGSALGLLVACSGRLPVTARLYALAIPAVDPNVTAKCTRSKPFPLMVFAGRLDQTVPYGGTPDDPQALSAPRDWFTWLAPTVDRCSSSSGATRAVPDGEALTFDGCTKPATFFTVDDGVHTWPGGPTGAGGLDPGTFPAARLSWCASGLTAIPAPVADCAALLNRYHVSAAS